MWSLSVYVSYVLVLQLPLVVLSLFSGPWDVLVLIEILILFTFAKF